ncbi:alpha-tocopherol transfer protein-like [Bacillus rossius redtenbacheri]|uniref:alpha-tocopherol transfer protein-like n=1 Tax=Bacillus rossius redtenbacheri TaxID=93214 RepID=UPI002FDE54A5
MKDLSKKSRQPFLHGLPQVDLPKSRQDNMEHVRSWLDFQPHLPELTDEHLHLYLHACYDNLEKTKQMIESCYTFRTLTPELFSNRDVYGHDFQGVIETCEVMLLPRATPEGHQVAMFRFTDYDASKLVYVDGLKALFIAIDVYLSMHGLSSGCICVIDVKGVNLGHVAKIHPLSLLKKSLFFIQECMPVRLKGVHVVNTGTIIEKVMTLCKPFLKEDLARLLHFHAAVDNLGEHLPLDILPEEYGGKAGSSASIYNELKNMLFTHYVDWLGEEEGLRTDESKRVGQSAVKDTLFGAEGSFRKLQID